MPRKIVWSSDEGDDTELPRTPTPDSDDPRPLGIANGKKNSLVDEVIEISSDEDEDLSLRTHPTVGHPKPKSTANEVIDLTLDSDEEERDASPPGVPESRDRVDDSWSNDGAILTLDEPRSARKPMSTPSKPRKATPTLRRLAIHSRADSLDLVSSPGTDDDPSASTTTVPSTPRKTPKSTSGPSTPRANTKKATVAAEQARREAYARKLFDELNEKVFMGGLPQATKLNWNNRLLTTAGRARWHRSRDGVETVEIELAIKILDHDARIRNTLAHEMCHLACWIIDKNPQENHGQLFKSWAVKVMRKMPQIEVTTKHSYEINYPYEWKCENCSKIYGRFSKSIRPEECVCGACKTGKLMAQFTTRPKVATRSSADARNATVKSRDSPHVTAMPGYFDSGDELDDLIKSLGAVDIAGRI